MTASKGDWFEILQKIMENPSIESGTSQCKASALPLELISLCNEVRQRSEWVLWNKGIYWNTQRNEMLERAWPSGGHNILIEVTELNFVENYTFFWKLSFAFSTFMFIKRYLIFK